MGGMIIKMGPGEDPEAFLETLSGCLGYPGPQEQWAMNLVSYLTREAQTAYWALRSEASFSYDMLKFTILGQVEFTKEAYTC